MASARRISCSIVDGQLQILCDGSRWTVPRELIEHSPILVDTLQSTGNVGCESLVCAPAGYLESYLAHVSGGRTCTRQVATAGPRNASNGSLTRYFQVRLSCFRCTVLRLGVAAPRAGWHLVCT